MDNEEVVGTELEYITIEELVGEDPERDHLEKELEHYGKKIKYRAKLPLETLLRYQRRFLTGRKKRTGMFIAAILRHVLLVPKINDDRTAALLLKGDGGVLMDIVNDVIGGMSDELLEGEDESGE